MPTKTPVKWEEKTLGELCISIDDGDWIESKNQSSEGIRLVQTGNVGNGFFKNKGEKAKFISEETFKKLNCTEIFENDCLVSRLPDPIGRACLIPKLPERMITAVDCAILKFDLTKILPQYFVYYSLSNKYLSDVKSHSSGATRQRISRTNLGTINIPIPSLEEQRRIVEILDKAFEDIEQMKENAKQNLQNAKDLFDSYLNQLFTTSNHNWTNCIIKDVASSVQYGYTESATFEKIGPKFLRITDIQDDAVEWASVPYCKIDDKIKSKYLLKDGDLVFARTGATVGKSYLIQGLNEEAVFASYLIRLSFIDKVIYPAFMKYYFKSNNYWQQVIDTQTGAGQPNVNGTKLSLLKIKYPAINEQQEIVKKLDGLQEETKQLEQIYQQKIEQTEELKQSILQKAFNGGL